MILSLYLDKKTVIDEIAPFFSQIASYINEITIPCDTPLLERDGPDYGKTCIQTIKAVKQQVAPLGTAINLAIDTVCTGGGSITHGYRRRLSQFLDEVLDLDVNVILSEPMLIAFVLEHFKELPVIIYAKSSHGVLDFHMRAHLYEDILGKQGNLKRIIIPSDLNRDFQAIKRIRNLISCEMGIIVNEGDIFCNPFAISEQCSLSHLSATHDLNYLENMEHLFQLKREELFLKAPWRFIASPWVRPQDLYYYEDLGVDCSIILAPPDQEGCRRIVQVYGERRYHGNLLHILRYGKPLAASMQVDCDDLNLLLAKIQNAGGCIADCTACQVCKEIQEMMESSGKEAPCTL